MKNKEDVESDINQARTPLKWKIMKGSMSIFQIIGSYDKSRRRNYEMSITAAVILRGE